MEYVIAREQVGINQHGEQRTIGYDHTSVVGRGRSLAAAARRSGGWESKSGYYVWDGKTEVILGRVGYSRDDREREIVVLDPVDH